MSGARLLLINAAGYVGGDTAMILLGLPYLAGEGFEIHAASVPRGAVYERLRATPRTTVYPLELGGRELHPAGPGRRASLRRLGESLAALPRLLSIARACRADLIYSGDRTVSMPLSYALSLLTGLPLVLNAQISHYLETSRLHRAVVRRAAKITVSSEHMRRRFLPYVDSPRRLARVPNAIDVSRYDPGRSGAALRAEFNIPAAAHVVVLAGRLSPWKGQEDLIRAAPSILAAQPDTYFLLAGIEDEAGERARLEQLIAGLGLGQRVLLLGYRQDVPALFAAADVVTMPSHEEPFGLVALEAMAMGKPVVATRAGGVPDFLVDGEMGYLIEPHDTAALARSILRLLGDPARAREMGALGRRHVEQGYDAPVYGQQLVEVFRQALAGRGGGMAGSGARAALPPDLARRP